MKSIGEYNNKAEVWAQYPAGGLSGETLKIGTDMYQWNAKEKDWTKTTEPIAEGLARESSLFKGDVDVNNDLNIGGVLRARIVRGRTAAAGLYDSEADLISAVPNPQRGQWALVKTATQSEEDTFVGEVYVCRRDGVWADAGYTAGSDGEGEALLNEKEARESGDHMLQDAILNIKPVVIEGNVTNNADEEDITSVEGTLKLKDKVYLPATYSGLGRKNVRKNIANGKNILTQEIFSAANTRYIIQYDYSLEGESITIPAGCIIEFQGGSVKDGTLIGTNTRLVSYSSGIFEDMSFSGTWIVPQITTDWLKDPQRENALTSLFSLTNGTIQNDVVIENGTYPVSTNVVYGDVIVPNSNTHITINGTIQLVNSYFRGYCVINTLEAENVVIDGNGSIIGNNDSMPVGIDGEFGFGVWLQGKNLTLRGIHISKCWGDAVIVGEDVIHGQEQQETPMFPGAISQNVVIENVTCFSCRRQGISVLHGENILINNCTCYDIHEIDPRRGIDVEPLYSWQKVNNVEICNCTLYDCHGLLITSTSSEDGVTGVKIHHNNLYDITGIGMYLTHIRNIEIFNNHIDVEGTCGIMAVTDKLTGSYYIIRNNVINVEYDGTMSDSTVAILVGSRSDVVEIKNNKVTFPNGYFTTGAARLNIYNNVIETSEFMTEDAVASTRFKEISIRNNSITCDKMNIPYLYTECSHNQIVCGTLEINRGRSFIKDNNITISSSTDITFPEAVDFRDNFVTGAGGKIILGYNNDICNNTISNVNFSIPASTSTVIINNNIINNSQNVAYIETASDNVSIIGNSFNNTYNSNTPYPLVVTAENAKNIIFAFNTNLKCKRLVKTESNTGSIITSVFNSYQGSYDKEYYNARSGMASIAAGIPVKGDSSSRPTLSQQVTHCYFDTTLGKPIWWNGTAWVDATGTAVS